MAASLALPTLAITLAGVSLTVATACTGIAYLVVRSTGPDLADRRIPREPCWQAGLVGSVAATAALFLGPSLSAFQLLGTLPVTLALLAVVTVSWWFGHGGFGDVRLVAAYVLLTSWWITLTSLLAGLAVLIVYGVGAAAILRSSTIPAGPALSAMFATAAALSLVAPSL